jgi:hypothetical protein
MATIWRSGLSMGEAECFLADVWCILEAAHIASPHISVITYPDGHLDILLGFDRRRDAELVESRQGSPVKQHQNTLLTRRATEPTLMGGSVKNAILQ